MRRLALALMLAASPAMAGDLVVRAPGVELRLRAAACTDQKVLRHITEGLRRDFREVAAVLSRKRIAGCWRDEGAVVLVVMEDGTGGRLAKAEFSEDVGI